MSKKRTQTSDTLTAMLREAIAESESYRGIQKATGVDRRALERFMNGKQSLRLDKADALCRYFGITHKQKGR